MPRHADEQVIFGVKKAFNPSGELGEYFVADGKSGGGVDLPQPVGSQGYNGNAFVVFVGGGNDAGEVLKQQLAIADFG